MASIEITTADTPTLEGIREALNVPGLNEDGALEASVLLRNELNINTPPRVLSLIRPETGYVTSPRPTVTNCTATLSAEQTLSFSNSIKCAITGAVTAVMDWNPGPNPTLDSNGAPTAWGNLAFNRGLSEIGMGIYLSAAANVSLFELEVTTKLGGGTSNWRYVINDGSLVDGWNQLRRFASSHANTGGWAEDSPEITRVRFIIVTTGSVNVYVDHVYGVERSKSSLIFMSDLSEKYFLEGTDLDGAVTGGLPDFNERKLPCTLACLPGQWGTSSARPTVAMIQAAAAQGHVIGLHSFSGENTASMNLAGMRNYAIKGINAIKQAKVPWFPFRSAWFQNAGNMTSTQTGMDDLFYGLATWNANLNGMNSWPPINRRNIGRYPIHNNTDEATNTVFSTLKNTHQVAIHYTHYITNNTGSTTNMVKARWDHYLTKLDEGLSEGWLEVVTPEILFRRAGGRLVADNSRFFWEWRETDGTIRRILA